MTAGGINAGGIYAGDGIGLSASFLKEGKR